MHTLGKFVGAGRDLEGNLTITLAIDDDQLEPLEKLKDNDLVIDIKKYSPKRSLNANAYFWVLCDKIAKALGNDKDTIYLLQLSKYGVFVDVEIKRDALDYLRGKFRYVEDFDDGYTDDFTTARCYFGSSQYSRREMSDLINGTVQDAHDLGIKDIWTDEEIQALIENWEGSK